MKFVIQPAAREDILRQYRYYLIEKSAEETAGRFLAAIQEAIQQIARRPGIGSPKALDHPALAGLRSASIRRFPAIRAYYLVSGDTVRVLRVLHGKRDIAPILESEVEGG
ncbi:MAG: type II toxin-antitoxin system RelE/ParE family toxin [Acidobacteriaceae bacterium]